MTAASATLAQALWHPPAAASNRRLRLAALCIVGSVLLAASAKISIPILPVPFTLQTLVVLVIGIAFGSRLAAASVGLYLLEGMVGLPVFAGGGGPAYLLGPTGGFLAGFLAAAWTLGMLAERGWGRTWQTALAAMLIGEVLIFTLGVGWLAQAVGYDKAVVGGLLPFLPGEAIKIVAAIALLPLTWKAVRSGQQK